MLGLVQSLRCLWTAKHVHPETGYRFFSHVYRIAGTHCHMFCALIVLFTFHVHFSVLGCQKKLAWISLRATTTRWLSGELCFSSFLICVYRVLVIDIVLYARRSIPQCSIANSLRLSHSLSLNPPDPPPVYLHSTMSLAHTCTRARSPNSIPAWTIGKLRKRSRKITPASFWTPVPLFGKNLWYVWVFWYFFFRSQWSKFVFVFAFFLC